MTNNTGIIRVRSLADEQRSARPRYHTHLDAFLMSQVDLTERRASDFLVGDVRLSRADLYRRLLDNTRPVPEDFCDPLGVTRGSTYGDAARMYLMQMGEIPKPTFLQLIG